MRRGGREGRKTRFSSRPHAHSHNKHTETHKSTSPIPAHLVRRRVRQLEEGVGALVNETAVRRLPLSLWPRLLVSLLEQEAGCVGTREMSGRSVGRRRVREGSEKGERRGREAAARRQAGQASAGRGKERESTGQTQSILDSPSVPIAESSCATVGGRGTGRAGWCCMLQRRPQRQKPAGECCVLRVLRVCD